MANEHFFPSIEPFETGTIEVDYPHILYWEQCGNPDGDPVLFVHLKFRLVESGINPRLLSDSAISLRRALWAMGERRFPHLRYDFHDDQRILGTENW